MASSEFTTVLEQFRTAGAELVNAPTVEEQRAGYEAMAFSVPDQTTVTPVDASGVPCEWIVADGADPDVRLEYLHGGGYVIGNLNTHRHLSAAISHAAGCAVLAVDYRLAPEQPYPAAVEDGLTAYRFMRENGPNGPAAATSTFISGDSAGGGLTLVTMLAARAAGVPLPDAAIPLSAWTDLAFTGESLETRMGIDPLITDIETVATMANAYLDGADPKDPLVSPLYADLSGLPPLLMQVGDAEVLLSDTTRVVEKARAAGVEVTEEVWPEMFHVFQHYCQAFPEGQESVDRIGAFVQTHVKVAR
jgi:monoterpene epsilon-lactone hydrolase